MKHAVRQCIKRRFLAAVLCGPVQSDALWGYVEINTIHEILTVLGVMEIRHTGTDNMERNEEYIRRRVRDSPYHRWVEENKAAKVAAKKTGNENATAGSENTKRA